MGWSGLNYLDQDNWGFSVETPQSTMLVGWCGLSRTNNPFEQLIHQKKKKSTVGGGEKDEEGSSSEKVCSYIKYEKEISWQGRNEKKKGARVAERTAM